MSCRDTETAVGALTFEPHLEERVWGGRHLESYGRSLPPEVPVGESWEISSIPGRSSVISRGPHKGTRFDDLLREKADAVVGDSPRTGTGFPLLLKLLDSAEPLSVQLHPNDREAVEIEGPGERSVGKTEAWIILEAQPGAEIIHGLAPGVEPRELYERLESLGGGRLSPREERALFRWARVRRGDVVFVPAGTIHALGAGVVLAEVQQTSDLTYRLYDWGREDARGGHRELHLDKARRVGLSRETPCPWTTLEATPPAEKEFPLVVCDKFRLELLTLGQGGHLAASTREPGSSSFHILFGWTGTAVYSAESGDTLEVRPASFVLLPASAGAYELRSSAEGCRCVRIRGGAAPS